MRLNQHLPAAVSPMCSFVPQPDSRRFKILAGGTQSVVCSLYHGNHWTRAHVVDEGREEWSVLQVHVVLLEEVFRGLQHRDDSSFQTCSLTPGSHWTQKRCK